MKLAIAVVHAPWGEGRVESLQRLLVALGFARDIGFEAYPGSDKFVQAMRVFKGEGPEPPHVWSERVFSWFESRADATHFLQLQDDAILCPRFLEVLRALLTANPNRVINLYSEHPSALDLMLKGCNGYTTSDWMVGVASVLPRSHLMHYRNWQVTRLRPGARERVTEDTLLGMCCAHNNWRILHPLPTPVDHDASLPSLYGNDRAPMRRHRQVPMREEWDAFREAATWEPRNPFKTGDSYVHLGRIHPQTHYGVARWVLNHGGEDYWGDMLDRIERDVVSVVGRLPGGGDGK